MNALRQILQIFVLSSIVLVTIIFAIGEMGLAKQKPLWLDETYGLEESAKQSYASFIVQGAISEPSPSPLDYITNKIFIDIKGAVNAFNLNDEMYFRIKPLFATILGLIAILWILIRELSLAKFPAIFVMQNVFLFCIPFALFFQTQIFFYAIETRSYALWTALYAWVLLASFRVDKNPWGLMIALSLMAATSIASLYQTGALLIIFIGLKLLQREGLANILKQCAIIFILPLGIALYYYSFTGSAFMDRVATGGTYADFMDFWCNKLITVPLMLIAAGLALYRRETRMFALAPLAFMVYFLMGPLIFYMTTHVRGYFYAERQFICYDLMHVVFIATLFFVLPYYLRAVKSLRLCWIIVLIVCLMVCLLTFRSKKMNKWKDVYQQFNTLIFNHADINHNPAL